MSIAIWWRRVRGLDFPPPKVGQLWKSQNSGKVRKITEVSLDDWGGLNIYACSVGDKTKEPGSYAHIDSTSDTYARGLGHWRLRLREERRVLVGMAHD